MPRILIVNTIKQWLYKKGNGWLIVTAFLLALSIPGIGIWPLAWFGLIPALKALELCKSWREAFIQGLFWGSLYHGVVFLWFWGMHPVTWMGFSQEASLLITGLGWGISALSQGFNIGIVWLLLYYVQRKNTNLLLLAAPVLWVALLWFLNLNPIGLPWGFLAYSQAPVDLIRKSTYTLTFWGLEALIILVNVSLFLAIRKLSMLLVAGFSLILILSAALLNHPPKTDLLKKLQPVIIQGNIPLEAERLFLTEKKKRIYYQVLINQALKDVKGNTNMIVLPEGAIFLGRGEETNPYQIPEATSLLSGGLFRSNKEVYNGAILFSNGKIQTFAKRYLVPFGETTPFVSEGWLAEILKGMGVTYNRGFSEAPPDQLLLEDNGIKIGPLICFEALYPNLTLGYRKEGANLLVTFSNLGWYHQNHLLEAQFLAVNQMRAAESGVPLILATNTGVSAIISEEGDLLSVASSERVQFLRIAGADSF